MLTLQTAIAEFLEAKALSCSDHTLQDYGLTLRRALDYWGDCDVALVEPADVRGFLETIPGSDKNVLNAYIGLSSFWTWVVQEGHAPEHVIRRVEAPKPVQMIIRPFRASAVTALLDNCLNVRDRAILLFLLDTGVRASELCGIRLRDLDGEFVRVLGKGKKERLVPMSHRTLAAILHYLHERHGQHERFLFTTLDGRRLKRHSLQRIVLRIGQRAGVEKVHPHRFRHTFAVNYLANGGDAFTLQRILGHSTLAMVNRYLNLATEDLARVHRAASPVKNWGL